MQKRNIIFILGTSIGCIFLAFFLYRFNWQDFFKLFTTLHYPSLAGLVLLLLLSVCLRTLRLEILVRASASESMPFLSRLSHCWHAVNVGYFGNFILPARAGEVLRIFQIHKTLHIDFACSVSISIMDRAFDVWTLFILGLALVGFVFSHLSPLMSAFFPLLAVAIIAFIGIGTAHFYPNYILKFIQFLTRPLPYAWQEKLHMFVDKAVMSVRMGSLTITCYAFFLSFCAFTTATFMCYLCFSVFGWNLPFEAALLMEFCICLAGSLPSAPGYFGLYQVATIFVLTQYGYSIEDGVAYALILQALYLFVFFTLGGQGFFASRKQMFSSKAYRKN